jgi:hypothetical protein
MRLVALLLALVSCRDSPPNAPTPAPAAPATSPVTAKTPSQCELLPFAETTPVPEASGAAWLAGGLLVISDSGNDGAYAIVDPETGKTVEEGKLPLGDPEVTGADLEGVASRSSVPGTRIYTLTGAGWVRVYTRAGAGFTLVDGPYALGPVDLADKKLPAGATGMVCPGHHGNCGRDYEGLCLAPDATGSPCDGFAAAKADGRLYCLHLARGRLAVDRAISIPAVDDGKSLADCAFSAAGELYVGANAFGAGRVYQVHDWRTPARARVVPIAPIGPGFPETLAVAGDLFYRMSDMGGAPSLMAKYRCK